MSKKHDEKKAHDKKDDGRDSKVREKPTGRTPWLDDSTEVTLVHEYAQRLNGFLDAMADGKIEKKELKEQEARVVALMKKIEPELGATVHEDITALLCELTAYNIMHTVYQIVDSKPNTTFRG